jgi:ketopantoate reductase
VALGAALDVSTPTLRVLMDLIQAKTQITLLESAQK